MLIPSTPSLCRLLCCVLFLAWNLSLQGQDADVFKPDSLRKRIHAINIEKNITIDGQLTETEWQLAPVSPPFTQIEPQQGDAASQPTFIKALYNHNFLYIAVFSSDTLGKRAIRATDFKRDFSERSHDLVSIGFDGFNDQRNAMTFATNPYGVQRDYLSFDAQYFDYDWDGLWKVRTNRTDSGWYAEIAIPWKTLRYKKSEATTQQWGFNVYRNRRITNEISALSAYPRAFTASRMDYAGIIDGLEPPPPRTNLRIQPYLLTSIDRFHTPTDKSRYAATKVGGDAKWVLNPTSVLDLTFNTDFAQADADLQVNNISRFSVFFPERRQFFLENASLFGPSIQMETDGAGGSLHLQPFFSRTIGLGDRGRPIPIVAGTRYVHRSGKANYGGIAMRQEETPTSPATNFFVGRYSQNLGEQNRIGALLSMKNDPGNTNTTATVDGFFRLDEKQTISSILSFSHNSVNAQPGFGGIIRYMNSDNQHKFWLTQSLISQNYDPQMGFVSRTDVIGTTPGYNWYYRGKLLPLKKYIRAFEPGFIPEFYWQASTGKMVEANVNFWPLWLNFQNGGYVGYSITPWYQRLTAPFEPLGVHIAEGEYRYWQSWMMASTDPSRIVSLSVDYRWGGYYNGKLRSGNWKLQFAPLPHISILAQLNRNHFSNVGVADTTATLDLYILQARFAINPRLQLTGVYQKNSYDHSDSYYIRFSWEYLPLSYLFLIYNHGSFTEPTGIKQSEDHAILKLSLLKQF